MIDKADLKKGFFIALGALAAILLWGLVTGGLGKLRG